MKAIRNIAITECEFCGKRLELESPPSDESYNNARINIDEHSNMLLPDDVGKENNHAISLAGYYCGPACLIAFLRRALGTKSDKVPELVEKSEFTS